MTCSAAFPKGETEAEGQGSAITAKSALVMNMTTGEILYAKSPDDAHRAGIAHRRS
ncbi:MAG: hypothetical protein MZU91_15270 [Desulfosudis oleivorans]|nr:hypothetical protein [Desulfosudis oleivorans]